MDPEKIGKFICQLRKEKNLSQYQLAELIPISRQGVSKWERGVTTPDPQTLLQLSEMFDVSINELLKGERLQENTIEDLEKTTLSILDQSNKKTKVIKRISITSIIIIAALLLAFLSYYFINSYNKIEIYKIGNTSKNFNITDGIYIATSEKYYLKLGKITNKIDAEIINAKLYYKKGNHKIILIDDNDVDNITIMESYGYAEILTRSDIKNLKDNLYLEIIYNEGQKDTIKLRYKRDYKNDSLFFLKQPIHSKETVKKELKKVELEETKEEKPKEEVKPTIKEEKQTQEKTIEKKEETKPVEEQQPKEEQPKDETSTEEQTNNEEPPEPEITPELIINKIKEKCTLDLDSYMCEKEDITIYYYEDTNQMTIFKGEDVLLEYDFSKDKYFCFSNNCKEELNNIVKETLLS